MVLYATSNELTGLYLHSGEFALAAIDSFFIGRGLKLQIDGNYIIINPGLDAGESVSRTEANRLLPDSILVPETRGFAGRQGSIGGAKPNGPLLIDDFKFYPDGLRDFYGYPTNQNNDKKEIRSELGPILEPGMGGATSPLLVDLLSLPNVGGVSSSFGGGIGSSQGRNHLLLLNPIPFLGFDCPSFEVCDYYFENGLCDLYNECYDAAEQCQLEAAQNGAPVQTEIVSLNLTSEPHFRKDCDGKSGISFDPVTLHRFGKIRGLHHERPMSDTMSDYYSPRFSSGANPRTYRSQVSYHGPLGHGWDHVANQRLAPSGGDIICYNGQGRADLFIRTSPTTFDSPPGIYDILIQNPDGSFTRRQPNGTLHNYHAFDGSNIEGAVESVEDRNGNFVSYLYDNRGLLISTVDTMGRNTHYGYDALGRITSITDFAGREVQYGYDGNGDLVTVRSPVVPGTPNGNDFPLGKVTTYQYTSGFADDRLNHNLTAIIRPNEEVSGLPAIQFSYSETPGSFDFDRVVTQIIGGTNASGIPAGGQVDFSYTALNAGLPPDPITDRRQADVTDRNGNQIRFIHNHAGNLLSRTDFTNRDLRPGEPDYTTAHSYDGEGNRLTTVLPEGNQIQYTYDSLSPNRGSHGNLTQLRLIADDGGTGGGGRGDGHGGTLADRVWSSTYEPMFNKVLCSIDPRGNDSSYVPQNGGAQSAARYTSCRSYCYMEQTFSTNGIESLATRFGIDLGTVPQDLGDLNGDGRTDQAGGNLVKLELPAVQLDPLSQQAAIEGDTSQEIVALYQWNDLGQIVAAIDPEGNTHEYDYNAETDPDGDGVGSVTPDDGRVLDPDTGGYLRMVRFDTTADPTRNNGTDPTPADIQVDYEYDEVGNVTGVVDGRGVRTRFTVNELNQVEEICSAAATADTADPCGGSPTGRGETGLTPFGFITRYVYDANDNVVLREVEDRGATRGLGPFIETTYAYDILDNPVSMSHETTPTTSLITQFAFDANENLIEVTQPEGNTHEWAWDERGLLLTTTRGASGLRGGVPAVSSYEYDGNANLTRFTDPLIEMVDVAYDGFDRPATTTDRIGNTVDSFYDPVSNVTRTLYRGPIGGPTPADRSGTTNADLAETFYRYDELNRPFRSDQSLFVPGGVTPARTPILAEGPFDATDGAINMGYEYDRLSRMSFVTRDSGAMTRLDYDGAGRVILATLPANSEVWTYTYDDTSNLVESKEVENPSTGAGGPPAETFLTTAFHDALGRTTMVVDNLGQTGQLEYDSLNAVVATSGPRGPNGGTINRRSAGHESETIPVNAPGNVAKSTYDGAGRLLTTVQVLTSTGEGDGTLDPTPDDTNPFNPDGLITTTTVWDDNSLPAMMLDDRGNQTSYTYDNLNRLVEVMADDETVTQYSYDPMGNVTAMTDANGSEFLNTYDAAHRLIGVEVTTLATGVVGTTEQSFEYDGLNRLTLAMDNNDPANPDDDVTTTRFYDSLSRLIEEGQQIGVGAGVEVLTTDYGWLAANLMTDLVYPDGRQIRYDYDPADRLVSVEDLDATRTEGATYDYFGLGRVHTRTYNNGVVSTMLDDAGTTDIGFDGVKRVTLLRHIEPAAGSQHAAFEYRYDRANNPTSHRRLHHGDGTGNFMGEIYAYDSAHRLTSFEERFMDVDHIGQSAPVNAIDWTHDGTHNWAEWTRNGVDFQSTPNNRNQYAEAQSGGIASDDGVLDDFRDDAGTADPDGLNFAYDENGNTREDGYNALSFDAFNRLVSGVRNSSGAEAGHYTYDALGRRVTRVTETEAHRYLHAGEGILALSDLTGEGLPDKQIVYGGGSLWQVLGDGTRHYFLEDPRGSVVALFDGGVVERTTYGPYGKPQFESPGNVALTDASGNFAATSQFGNTILWHGWWYDPELGARTDDVLTDWGGLYRASSGVGYAASGTLHSFDLNDGDVSYAASGKVPGWSLNQFSVGKADLGQPGSRIIDLFQWMTDALAFRLNNIPERDTLEFLSLAGRGSGRGGGFTVYYNPNTGRRMSRPPDDD